jgi:colanic acid biosynthesis glycosyl transferase WcaI
MKILIYTMYFLPEFGSAPILMNELATYLAQAGHDVEIITTLPRPPHNRGYEGKFFARETRHGFRVTRFLTNSTPHYFGRLVAWSIFTALATIHLFSVRRGDVLFLRLPPLQLGLTGVLAKRLRGAKVLLNIQDIHPDLSIESGLLRNPFIIQMAKALEKWIYDHTENIIVISDGFKKNLEAKGVSSRKIRVLPNWVDTNGLRPLPKANAVSQKFLLADKFVVMYSGTISISSYATLVHLLEAARALRHESDIVFVIVGEGLKKNEVQAKAAGLNLPNIRFLPFQPYQDLPEL